MADTPTPRTVYRNITPLQILRYKLPPAGIVSILHRISGAAIFLLMPFVIWLFDKSVTSEISYAQFTSVYTVGTPWLPAFAVKLVTFGLIWAFLFHFTAGLRHLWMDVTHSVSNQFGRQSAWVTIVVSTLLTLALGLKLFF